MSVPLSAPSLGKAEPLLGTARDWIVDFAFAIVVGLFVGVIGPYGSYLNGGPGPRIFHFIVCFCVGTLIFGVLQRLAVAGAARWKLPVWPVVGVALLVGCVPLALFISWLATTLWPFLRGRIGPLEWYAQCVFLSGPVLSFVVVRRLLRARAVRSRALETIAPTPAPPSCRPRARCCACGWRTTMCGSAPRAARAWWPVRSSG